MITFLLRSFEDHKNGRPKMRVIDFFLLAIAMLALLALSNCTTIPNTASRVDKNKPVFFMGGVTAPNAEITIQAYDPKGTWDNKGNLTSEKTEWIYDTASAYPWWGWVTIEDKYWAQKEDWDKTQYPACASTGESALIRSKWGEGDLVSVVGNFSNCYLNHPGTEFLSHCLAPESPNLRVGSLNYRDFGKECGDLINRIRALENEYWKSQPVNPFGEIFPLQIADNEAGECEADCHAQCNYEWELDHPNQAHRCKPWEQHQCDFPVRLPAAQNECCTACTNSSIDEILNDCIWKEMYLDEKQQYKDHPDTCKGAGGDEECGHYMNMLKTNVTKVSCGLYKTPSGGFKAVQNFLP